MKKYLLALSLVATLVGFADTTDSPKVIIISPNDLVEAWETEYAAKVPAITGGEYEVVSTETIYEAHPYAAENTGGKPRNPAESIHKFIESKASEVQYFILGGPWVDIDDLAAGKVMKLTTGESLGLSNTVPGIHINTYKNNRGEIYISPSDMYYACFDSQNTYAWDSDGDGQYLESTEFADSAMTANVIVTRIPLVTYAEWKHEDGTPFTQRELLAAYVAKLQKGLAADFDGMNRYGFYAFVIDIENQGNGTGREITVQELGGDCDAYVERKETAFYDGGYNMFDPARANDRFVLAEGVSRRHVRDQIAQARPVDAVNGFYEETFSSKHKTREEARSSWTGENYALRFYYAHGNRGGGHGFGMDDYINKGCGLTLFDDCAGPCSTGKIEFDANGVYLMNYAIGCVMSPFGGSLTTINNTDFGIGDMNNFFKGFQPNDSWRYANNYLVGFVQENMNVGEAWKYNVTDFVTNYRFNNSALDTWMLAEEMLLGDPLVKLPAVTENLSYADGITYKGIENKKDVVVSMQIEGDKVINTPSVPLKVMNGLTTSGSSLTICTGEGGIGGEGVVFTGEKGALTLAGDDPFYVAGVKNVASMKISGSHQTIDFDNVELDGSTMGQLTISSADDITIRSAKEGAFSKIKNNLSVPRNGNVRLATWNAFGSATDGVVYLAKNSELIIGANPWYHDGNDRGESLNATITPMSVTADAPAKIRVEKGGLFTPTKALSNANYLSYEVDARDGLGGTVTVPNKAKLTLKELPLSKISTLTVESGATLVIPEGKTLDDLLSSGTATLKSGAKIACGAETTTLSEDKTVDGSKYVTKYYYTAQPVMRNDELNWTWTGSTKMSLDKDSEPNVTPEGNCEIIFAQGANCPTVPLYIESAVTTKNIHVSDNTSLIIGGESSQKWNLRTGFKVTVDDGSSVTFCGWGNGGQKLTNPIKFADGVVLDGKGLVTIDANDAPLVNCGNISGTATISLPVGVTITSTGTISNDIVVPEGYKLKTTTEGTTTTYVAEEVVEPPAIVSRHWESESGISHDSASPVVLFTGITLDDLMSDRYTLVGEIGGAWIKGGNSNISADKAVFGEKSGNEVNVQLQAKDSDNTFTGVKFVNLKLIEDGATIKAYQYGQGYKRSDTYEGYGSFIDVASISAKDGENYTYTIKSAVAWRRYVIEDAQIWDALPSDFHTGDTIEVTKDGELTLTFAMPQPVIGSGRVITTAAPSDVLKDSLTKDSWTGTFVLKGLEGNVSSDDLWNFDPSNYGNAGSQVELWNCKGFCAKDAVIERPIIITGEFDFANGYFGGQNTLSCLKGTGTITSKYTKMTYTVLDASEFYGTVANESVVILPTSSPSILKKNGYLSYTIDSDGVVQDLAVTENAQPTIVALTLGETTTVTIAAPIAGLTYALKSAATLDAEAWEADASTKAESSKPLTLEAKPSDTTSRFYKVDVSF
ncbi:MAG: hypothetical protein MJ109_03130 [Kiritimatiellae bacterium]|nr:hypothetical protein [Kiritimatiellia bacterium]